MGVQPGRAEGLATLGLPASCILVCRNPARPPAQLSPGAAHSADPSDRGGTGTEIRNSSWLCQMVPREAEQAENRTDVLLICMQFLSDLHIACQRR